MMEKELKETTWVEILFEYKGTFYSHRIYTNEIEIDHYENSWEYLFQCTEEDVYPGMVFEFNADKNEDGKLTLDNMYINVYEDESDSEPIDVIEKIGYKKSWIKTEGFR